MDDIESIKLNKSIDKLINVLEKINISIEKQN